MKQLTTNIDTSILSYLSIYEEEIPDFLIDYLEIKEFKRLKGIGLFCGCDYTHLFDCPTFYSRYDHSLGVALIIWHFTHDQKQTLAGLLHDVSSPVFSHVVDFFNNDHLLQESTEKSNRDILSQSQELLALLKRDHIDLEEVIDYKLYPIADNKKPQLSADRLEYMLSSGYFLGHHITLEEIKAIYQDLIVLTDEKGQKEIGFKTMEMAELFTKNACNVSKIYLSNEDKLALQLLADILKKMVQDGFATMEDFYVLTEAEMITRIQNSPYQSIYHYFQELQEVKGSDCEIKGKYCVKIDVKKRYIDPLLHHQRLSQQSKKAKAWIDEILHDQSTPYAYIDLEDFRDDH